jgi:nucleotide-binding universal stress UspA family protein
MSGLVLIAYDGSADAQAAVRQAGELFAGRTAVVLTVWESASGLTGGARVALPGEVVREAMVALDDAAKQEAEKTAAEGAALACDGGLNATALQAKAVHNVWTTILAEADRQDAAVVVVGSRGRSGIKAAILGSVSGALSANSRLPVLVVRADQAS